MFEQQSGEQVRRKMLAPRLKPETKRMGTALLDQQMWCWGQDIQRSEGNLLLAYGFTRKPPPQSMAGSSMYQWSSDITQQRITLWGFGLASIQAERGGLFLKRFGFTPRLLSTVDSLQLWALGQLPPMHLPRTSEEGQTTLVLFAALLHWISTYEQWIQLTCGREYRQRCLSVWRKSICPAEAIAEQWSSLAAQCQMCLDAVP